MGILEKLEKAKKATGGDGGNRRSFSSQSLWVNMINGDNEVRLGGNVVVCERHYVKDLVSPESMKSSVDQKAAVGVNATCMNWDIENQSRSEEELHCCAVCDLRSAANVKRKEAKEAEDEKTEKAMKEISGKGFARSRYSFDAIFRDDPIVKTKDADGKETEALGWKILNLGKEGREAIEALAKNYPQLADPDEGCDIVISRHKSNRITYGASYSLDGSNIKVTKLTEEERALEKIDLLRYTANHISPRVMFESLKTEHQELITEVLGKTAEDYPEECPVQKTPKNNDSEGSSEGEKKAPPKKVAAAAPAAPAAPERKASPKAGITKRSASVADEFDDIPPKTDDSESNNDTFNDSEEEQAAAIPAPPKTPAPPKEPSVPKTPKAPEAPKAPLEPEAKAPEPKAEEAASEPEAAPEEASDPPAELDVKDKPSCFGYHEHGDSECKKCNVAEECRATQ